jgi:tetratricopeptide (TPR) repeat protein
MKRRLILCVLAAVMAVLSVPAAWGQLATIKGYVKDPEGKMVPFAEVQLTNRENGRRYDLKTDKNGNYYSLGIVSGRYDVKVSKDGKLLFNLTNVPVTLAVGEETVVNIDLTQEKPQVSEEQKKEQESAQKESQKVKGLNEKLAAASAAEQAGNYEAAVQAMLEATVMDPTRDILWFKLADAERLSATKITAPADKTARYQKAAEDFKKAIAIKPMGPYYNNLGDAQAKSGDTAAAIASYDQAAQIDPQNAAMYYFNEGAVLTNTGKVDEATQAFDKAIQADPTKAEAYYQKAMNLLNKATLKGNKMEAPPGTEETLKKYLELQPTGEHAEIAKQMLAQLGATVETTFGKGKTGTKTKK